MPSIALVTNVLSHYRVPCFLRLGKLQRDRVVFFFLAREMAHRSYVLSDGEASLPAVWLKGWKWRRPPNDDAHLNDVRPVLKGRYDAVIIGGWDEPSYLLLWLWGALFNKKIIFWIESTAYDCSRGGMKERFKKVLLRYAAGCIVPGRRSAEYCSTLGMSPERIFIAPNAADREYFRGRADELIPLRESLRQQLGVGGVTILFVGRLVEEYKGVSALIEAFGKLYPRNPSLHLCIAGDGPERGRYEEAAARHGASNVHFLGMLDHGHLCRVYAAADIFVLPSYCEVWGFVLNEGMEFGLPMIVSEVVGAGPDLVRQGENGFVFPAGDAEALAGRLEILIKDEGLRRRMGEASRRIIEDFSPENWALGVKRAVDAVCGKTG